jgi:hypothetical protein
MIGYGFKMIFAKAWWALTEERVIQGLTVHLGYQDLLVCRASKDLRVNLAFLVKQGDKAYLDSPDTRYGYMIYKILILSKIISSNFYKWL